MDFNNILAEVSAMQIDNVDFITTQKNISMSQTGEVVFSKKKDVSTVHSDSKSLALRFSAWAFSQASTRLGMPVTYFSKLYKERPDLVAKHFNHWINDQRADSNILVRGTRHVNSQTGTIRAFLSDKYAVMDNFEVLEKIKEAMLPTMVVESFHVDEKRMHIRILDEASFGGENNGLMAGFDAQNSEIGGGSLALSSLLYRLVCSNGLRRWDKDEDLINQRHIYVARDTLRERLSDSIHTAIRKAKELMQVFEWTKEIQLTFPVAGLIRTAQEETMPKEFIRKAITSLVGDSLIGETATAYEVINAVTFAAKDFQNEQRLEYEKFAGKLLSFSPSLWPKYDVPLSVSEIVEALGPQGDDSIVRTMNS